ncbi:MAG: adenylate/guanylate cyclase domain-containing protein [Spirulinaceae cyanobacterium]
MNSKSRSLNSVDILIVDDIPNNLRLLSTMLAEQGYEVRKALSGQIALLSARTQPPDLILLDVKMPEMSGYEVCQKLQANQKTAQIPVIFVSALDNGADKVKAFEVGGVDYVTKPFQESEILVRVKNQLSVQKLQQQLKKQNFLLQAEIRLSQEKSKALQLISVGTASETGSEFFRACVRCLAEALKVRYAFVTETVDPNRTKVRTLAFWQGEEYRENFEYDVAGTPCQEALQGETGFYPENLQALFPENTLLVDLKIQSFYGLPLSNVSGDILGHLVVMNDSPMIADCGQNSILQIFASRAAAELERLHAQENLLLAQQRSDKLLLNILPSSIAERLKQNQDNIADRFDSATVLFADLVDFTPLSSQVSALELVNLLNQIFSSFDKLTEKYGLEKIKTIGDAYMVAGGLPIPKESHVEAIADLALDIQKFVDCFSSEQGEKFQIRIGINTGPVVAGVIGTKKFIYDLWGDTVNIASRMESQGISGRIQVTAATYECLKHKYKFESRGTVAIKGKGEMVTYWLMGKK